MEKNSSSPDDDVNTTSQSPPSSSAATNAYNTSDEPKAPFVRLSKAEKRKLKYEKKKAARVAQHKRMKLRKQEKRAEELAGMTEEEKQMERERRGREAEEIRVHLDTCIREAQPVAVDMGFFGDDTTFTEREANSLANQLTRTYGSIRRRECQLSLHLLSYNGLVGARLDASGAQGWRVHRHEGSLADVFFDNSTPSASNEAIDATQSTNASDMLAGTSMQRERRDGVAPGEAAGKTEHLLPSPQLSAAPTETKSPRRQLCYLTPDAEEELKAVDPRVTYIVGGIVDRNVQKGLSKTRADALGIKTARLPLHLAGMKSQRMVLNVDTVCRILGTFSSHQGNWAEVLKVAMPARHIHQAGGHASLGNEGGSGQL